MNHFDHILVCIDLTDMDSFLIRYSNFLVEQFKPKSITFMHVVRSYDIPKEMLESFPDLEESVGDIVKEDVQEKVGQNFLHKDTVETKVEVEEGYTTETIVDYARKQKITLTLLGKKIGFQGAGGVSRKILSLVPSSVLLVSETTLPKIENIMVRMDFTKITGITMKMALKIQESTQAGITCHHVYKLPLKYFPQNNPATEKRLKQEVEKHSEKEYQKFAKKVGFDPDQIPCTSTLDTESKEAQILYNQALSSQSDLIMIGSKIKSTLADIVLDNTSEKLAGHEKNIPVLVVKDRNQTLGFLEALFK
ncbi:MAG: universal stress protein [Salinivirgaceae bacterium]